MYKTSLEKTTPMKTHLPKPEKDMRGNEICRVETGILQFGDDCPGIFLRGDSAKAFQLQLENYMNDPNTSNVYMKSLLKILNSCERKIG